ncbi:putative long-chain-alcohol O-fatty-acyltransferase 1 [Nymphaea thermarum]|nr:putative long-chain-alcohol O-fatty-acyltransferase 1 [Nymphaea thermarum]
MGEMESLARVWLIALASFLYVYAVVARLPKNASRLVAVLPIAYLFLKIPWLLSSFFLRTVSAFFLVWLCNFRLVLFCFDSGPLAENRDSLIRFLVFAALPIKAQQRAGGSTNKLQQPPHLLRSVANLAIEAIVMLLCLRVYGHKEALPHQSIVIFVYSLHLMVTVDGLFVAAAVLARLCLRVELQPQFNRPFLSSSIRDFWARRWNLVVSSTLREAVYQPVRAACRGVIGRKRARDVGVVAAFLVSGLMHEVLLYYMTCQAPSWEWTAFFTLHGLLAAAEEWLEGLLGPGPVGRLPRAVKIGMTLTVLFSTGTWLFFPPVSRHNLDLKVASEVQDGVRFLVHGLTAAARNATAALHL